MPTLPDASLGGKQHDQESAAFKAYAKPQSAPQTFLGRWWKIWLVGGDVLLIGEQGAQSSAPPQAHKALRTSYDLQMIAGLC